jgi:hypothetical protein
VNEQQKEKQAEEDLSLRKQNNSRMVKRNFKKLTATII